MAGAIDFVLRIKDEASGTLGGLGAAADEASGGVDRLKDSAGDADSVLKGMAGAVGTVNPELASMVSMAGDAAGGLEALAKTGGLSVISLGALGLAVAALGAAYAVMQGQVAAADAMVARSTETTKAAVASFSLLRDIKRELAGEEVSAFEGRKAAVAAQINSNNELIQSYKDQIEAQSTFVDAAPDFLVGLKALDAAWGWASGRAAEIANLTTKINELNSANRAIKEQDIGVVLEGSETAGRVEFPKPKGPPAPRGPGAGVVPELVTQDLRGGAAFDARRSARVAISQASGAGADVSGLLESLTALEDIMRGGGTGTGVVMSLEDLTAAAQSLTTETVKQAEAAKRDLELSERAEEQERAKFQREAEQWAEARSKAIEDQQSATRGSVVGAAGGDIGPLLSQAGVAGAIVGAALSIGAMGSEGVEAKLDKLRESANAFPAVMIDVLATVIPDFIVKTLEDGPKAIVDAFIPSIVGITGTLITLPIRMATAFVTGFVETVLSADFWRTLNLEIQKALANAWRDIQASVNDLGGAFSEANDAMGGKLGGTALVGVATAGTGIGAILGAVRLVQAQAGRFS